MNEIYPIEIQELVNGMPVTRQLLAYTCGHCTSIVVMRDDRSRPRLTCQPCGRWICEKNELCSAGCTPVYSMSNDHFENAGKHGKFLRALMAGETKLDEAKAKGLIIP